MLRLRINNADVSDSLDDGSVSIVAQLQQKSKTLRFSLQPGVTAPSENQDVKLYDVVELVSASGTAIVVKDRLASGESILTFGKYRAGQYFWLGVGHASLERVEISAIAAGAAGQVNITLVTAIVNAHSAGQEAGRLIFAGTLTSVKDSNPRLLDQLQYDCQATDYTKIFDRKNVNDSWENKDARYILNDLANTTFNYNAAVDAMDYANDGAVQAEWIETGDGTNPTLNTADRIQGTSAVNFPWTNSGGTATFSATPTSQSISDLVGAASGTPTKGNLTFWYKRTVATGITSVKFRIGSSSSDYVEFSFVPEADLLDHFKSLRFIDGVKTGTPVWTAIDYAALIVTETASGSIMIDDLRVTADGSFTLYNVKESGEFDAVRAAQKKPTAFVERLAKTIGWSWYIDYEKDIHFFDMETEVAPFSIGDDTDNFIGLSVEVDASQLKNRQIVRGGTRVSTTLYTQVVQGNAAIREWIMKAQFSGLTIKQDNNTSTDLCEAGTTTTNVKATAHGLATGDYIVNRTRSNAVRQITVVDVDNFTVEAVASQTNGDTFSKFAATKTVGVENLDDEASFDYMSNFMEKSIRASEQTTTLTTTDFLLFSYYEVIPVRVQVSDSASIIAMKALVGGDGIFDGAVITDDSLNTIEDARDRAFVELRQYSNAMVIVSFKTNHEGLTPGQLLPVVDVERGIDDSYLIQRVRADYRTGDVPTYEVQCASTLFGIIEYFQRLSQAISDGGIDDDELVELYITADETVTIDEDNAFTVRDLSTTPYKWQPHATEMKWNLSSWG